MTGFFTQWYKSILKIGGRMLCISQNIDDGLIMGDGDGTIVLGLIQDTTH